MVNWLTIELVLLSGPGLNVSVWLTAIIDETSCTRTLLDHLPRPQVLSTVIKAEIV